MFPRRTIVFDINSLIPRNSSFERHSRTLKSLFIKQNINKDINSDLLIDYYENHYGSVGIGLQNDFDISIESYAHYMNRNENYKLVKPNNNAIQFIENNNCILFTNSPRYRAFKILMSMGIYGIPIISMEDMLYYPNSMYPEVNNMKPSDRAFMIAEEFIKLDTSDFVYFDDNRRNIYAAKNRNWRVMETTNI